MCQCILYLYFNKYEKIRKKNYCILFSGGQRINLTLKPFGLNLLLQMQLGVGITENILKLNDSSELDLVSKLDLIESPEIVF